jgi:hypothetical protein
MCHQIPFYSDGIIGKIADQWNSAIIAALLKELNVWLIFVRFMGDSICDVYLWKINDFINTFSGNDSNEELQISPNFICS